MVHQCLQVKFAQMIDKHTGVLSNVSVHFTFPLKQTATPLVNLSLLPLEVRVSIVALCYLCKGVLLHLVNVALVSNVCV